MCPVMKYIYYKRETYNEVYRNGFNVRSLKLWTVITENDSGNKENT